MTPHKHAELIKEWADGAEIQFYFENEEVWRYVESPQWHKGTKYRIKPLRTVHKYIFAYQDQDAWRTTVQYYSIEEAKKLFTNEHNWEAILSSTKEFLL